MTNFFWKIISAKTISVPDETGIIPYPNAITEVNWVCIGRTKQWLEHINGTTMLGSPSSSAFIPFEELKQADVLSMLFTVIDEEAIQAEVQKLIDAHNATEIVQDLVQIPD